jgi:hypothetical protein
MLMYLRTSGVLVPAPAYCALRARVDVVDLRLDLASAVASTLNLYEARQEDGGEESGESDDEWVSVTVLGCHFFRS